MSSYEISDFELQNAKKLNVEIIPSTVKDRKLDVIRDGKYLFSIGNLLVPSYSDWKNHMVKYTQNNVKNYIG